MINVIYGIESGFFSFIMIIMIQFNSNLAKLEIVM